MPGVISVVFSAPDRFISIKRIFRNAFTLSGGSVFHQILNQTWQESDNSDLTDTFTQFLLEEHINQDLNVFDFHTVPIRYETGSYPSIILPNAPPPAAGNLIGVGVLFKADVNVSFIVNNNVHMHSGSIFHTSWPGLVIANGGTDQYIPAYLQFPSTPSYAWTAFSVGIRAPAYPGDYLCYNIAAPYAGWIPELIHLKGTDEGADCFTCGFAVGLTPSWVTARYGTTVPLRLGFVFPDSFWNLISDPIVSGFNEYDCDLTITASFQNITIRMCLLYDGTISNDVQGECDVATYFIGYFIAFIDGNGHLQGLRAWYSDNHMDSIPIIDNGTDCTEPNLAINQDDNRLSLCYHKTAGIYRVVSWDYGNSWVQDPAGGGVFMAGVAHCREVYNQFSGERMFFYNDSGDIKVGVYDSLDALIATYPSSGGIGGVVADDVCFGATQFQVPANGVDVVFAVNAELRRFRSWDDGRTWIEVGI